MCSQKPASGSKPGGLPPSLMPQEASPLLNRSREIQPLQGSRLDANNCKVLETVLDAFVDGFRVFNHLPRHCAMAEQCLCLVTRCRPAASSMPDILDQAGKPLHAHLRQAARAQCRDCNAWVNGYLCAFCRTPVRVKVQRACTGIGITQHNRPGNRPSLLVQSGKLHEPIRVAHGADRDRQLRPDKLKQIVQHEVIHVP
ncbi:hypothetical protein N436_00544 [Pseudomonas sp. RV120224-01b]|nr:hypothetical protein N428_00545 [Pseudomonas sp. RV120224-01c]PYG86450.1 hypothetical protein N436_00544 [Pseudomonas sp. RV120224-01b]